MRRLLVVMCLLAASLVPAATVAAQDSPGLLLILDASGSMNRDAGGGVTLLDEAKDALRQIIHALPTGTVVGLRVYGHRTSNDNQAVGCADTELVVPVGPVNRLAMIAAVDEIQASGWTPIGLSLQEAVGDLGPAGGTIILVSDGVDTCSPPDPCQVAQQLAEDGFVTQIHTVGLLLQDRAAVDQLECIAEAGNGRFTGVDAVDRIFETLSGMVMDSVEGMVLPSMQGALERNLAPVMPWMTGEDIYGSLAASQGWIGAGEIRWFAVDVTEEDRQLAADAMVDWQPGATSNETIEIQIFDERGVAVGVPHEVAGVAVEAPQVMLLAEAADWFSAAFEFPRVLAVTDPASMFPSWEPNEDWFGATRQRFAEAGLNGGVYELWKRLHQGDPLEPGRYFVAVSWSSDRDTTSPLTLQVTMYPWELTDEWRAARPDLPVVYDVGELSPMPLHAERWYDGPLPADLGVPARAVEVWTVVEPGEPHEYTIGLEVGEHLLLGWDISYGLGFPSVTPEIVVTGPDGAVRHAPDADVPDLGYMGRVMYMAEQAGEHSLAISVPAEPDQVEPALAVSVIVLPGVPADEVEASRPEPIELALDAIMSGLGAVRDWSQGTAG